MPLRTYMRTYDAPRDEMERAVGRGLIERRPNGHINVKQAKEWQAERASRRGEAGADNDSRMVRARIASVAAKAQLAKHRVTGLMDSVLERVEVETVAAGEIARLDQQLRGFPTTRLVAIGVDPTIAEQVVDDFIRVTLRSQKQVSPRYPT